MLHHVNLAAFALPAQLKDQTMHRFTLQADGAGECSVVMSQAPNPGEDTLDDLAHDLNSALSKALPDFNLLSLHEFPLDGEPAIEIAYRWRKAFKLIRQRQVITLLPAEGEETSRVQLIVATCPDGYADRWNVIFDALLVSVKLRHRTLAPASVPVVAPVNNTSTVFVLSRRRRVLHAFADQDEACRKTDAGEVQLAEWCFYDAAGKALHAKFLISAAWWRKPGAYGLETRPEQTSPSLRDQLGHADLFVRGSASVKLSSIAEVRAMFDNLMEPDHACSCTPR